MKSEILKKTVVYRILAFVIALVVGYITQILFNDIFLFVSISEGIALATYYTYEYLWRRHIDRERVKKGMNVLMINGSSDKYNWYEIIEDLGEGKIIIKVV